MVKVASARFLHSEFTVPSFIIKSNLCGDTEICGEYVNVPFLLKLLLAGLSL